jgi:hypothetical protein
MPSFVVIVSIFSSWLWHFGYELRHAAPAVRGRRDKLLSAMRTSVYVSWLLCTEAFELNLPAGYFPSRRKR